MNLQIESISVVKSDCRRLPGLDVTRHSPDNLQQVKKQFHLSEKDVNVSPGIFHLTLNSFERELQCWFTQHALPTARKWNSDPAARKLIFQFANFPKNPFTDIFTDLVFGSWNVNAQIELTRFKVRALGGKWFFLVTFTVTCRLNW